jgi:hypothetical protein
VGAWPLQRGRDVALAVAAADVELVGAGEHCDVL